ncbi:hypothetical protein [Leptospira interrogans]|nr:hypothetical protein [Leptospira interrogans]
MILGRKTSRSVILLNRRSQEGRWQIDRSLGVVTLLPMDRSLGAL